MQSRPEIKLQHENEEYVEDPEHAKKVRRLDRIFGIALSPFALGWMFTKSNESLNDWSTFFLASGLVVMVLGFSGLIWLDRAHLKSKFKDFVERL